MKRADLGARAPNPRPRKERCLCGHARNVHTPLLGCIALVQGVPWRHCGCKFYEEFPGDRAGAKCGQRSGATRDPNRSRDAGVLFAVVFLLAGSLYEPVHAWLHAHLGLLGGFVIGSWVELAACLRGVEWGR